MSEKSEQLIREAVRHQKVLTCFAYTILKDWSLAEDAVQETFIAASRQHREIHNVKGWLKRITYNKSIDILRRRNKEVLHEDEELFTIFEQQFNRFMDDSHIGELEKKRKILKVCMKYLNETTHEIVSHFYRGTSCEDLAGEYERSVNSIWLTLSRARKNLRKCVKKQLNTGLS